MDSRDECPEEDTEYKLVVTWLDSTQTTRSIEVEVDVGGSSNSGTGAGTPTPGGTAAFVPVTPIPIATTPVSVSYSTPAPVSSAGAVVTPVGVLASVQVLPETGHVSPSPHQKTDGTKDDLPNRRYWWPLAGGLVLILAVAVVCSALRVRSLRISEVSR